MNIFHGAICLRKKKQSFSSQTHLKLRNMSKAENRALEAYPSTSHYWNAEPDRNAEAREFYKQGYRQAEKDMELTWEDIEAIDQLLWDLCGEYSGKKDNEGYYQEVLKRFQDLKK
jgi:hypothetical protein